MRFIQRNPCQPKCVWWKRFRDKANIGKRVIYVATPSLGFEVDGYPQRLVPRALINKIYNCSDTVEYVSITDIIDNVVTPTKAICLLNIFYMFNPTSLAMKEEDIVDDGVQIIQAETSDVIMIEKNTYVKKNTFDCFRENDQQSSAYQPIQGLITDSTYLSLKTYNFCDAKDKPQHDDVLYYQGKFWIVEETSESYVYSPRETAVLHLSASEVKEQSDD